MRDPHHKRIFKYASNAYRIYNRACFRSYVHRVQAQFKIHPKAFWGYADKRRKSNDIPSHLTLGNPSASGTDGCCNLLAEHGLLCCNLWTFINISYGKQVAWSKLDETPSMNNFGT